MRPAKADFLCVINSNGTMLNRIFESAEEAETWAEENAPVGTWSVVKLWPPKNIARETWVGLLQAKLDA